MNNMKRRGFLGSLVALFAAPLVPIVPLPTPRKRIFDGGPIYCTSEMMADIRAWGVDQIDEMTRKEIYACDGVESIYGTTC